MTIEMMKFTLLYLFVLTIILLFNYGAHSEQRRENELEENELDCINKKKLNGRVDEQSFPGRVDPGTIWQGVKVGKLSEN